MTNQVQLFAPLKGLIEKTRAGLTANSPMRDIAKRISSLGLNDFLEVIIYRYTGLTGGVFVLSDSMRPNASTSIMYKNTSGKQDQRHSNAMEIIGKYGRATANLTTPAIRDLFNLSRGYQTKSSIGLPERSAFRIYIRIAKRFFLPNEDGTFPYTAGEVAGIICHEIGHTIWNVTAADQILFADTTFNQAISLIKANPKVEEIKKVLDLIYKDKLYPASLKSLIEALRGMSVTDASNDYRNYCEVSVWVIMAISAYTKKSTIDRFWTKPMDRYTGANMATSVERFCDSFAGQCGYGGDLASALAKFAQTNYSPADIQRTQQTSFSDAFLTAVLNPYAESPWSGYDSVYDRMKAAIYATKQSLSSDDLTTEEKAEILAVISRGEAAYAEYTSQPYVRLRHAFFRIQTALGMIKTFSPSAFGSVLEKTFSEFHDALQVYNSGELSYFASLLETT